MRKLMNKMKGYEDRSVSGSYSKQDLHVNFRIHGSDPVMHSEASRKDMDTLGESSVIQNIEAGSRMFGTIIAHARTLPVSPYACVKIKIKGLFELRVHKEHKDSNGNSRWSTSTQKQKFYEEKVKWILAPEFIGQVSDSENFYPLRFPFAWDVKPQLCGSLDKKLVYYKMRVKLFFDGNESNKMKSPLRPIAFLPARPTTEQVYRQPVVDTETKRNWMTIGEGNVEASASTDAYVFMEGEQLAITVNINNKASRDITKGDISIVKLLKRNSLYIPEHGGRYWRPEEDKKDVLELDLMSLDIRARSTLTRTYSITVPENLLVHSTGFKNGDYFLEMSFYAKVRFSIAGRDVRVRVPVLIAPKITRYTVSVPSEFEPYPEPYNQPIPLGYAMAPPYPPAFTYSPYPKFRCLKFHVVKAEKLPKMDGFLAKADPYVTVLVNDRYFANTKYVSQTLEPYWGESFDFYLNEQEAMKAPIVLVKCFDYDKASSNDLIGEFVLDLQLISPGISMTAVLEKEYKKNKNEKIHRGILTYMYEWF